MIMPTTRSRTLINIRIRYLFVVISRTPFAMDEVTPSRVSSFANAVEKEIITIKLQLLAARIKTPGRFVSFRSL